jgi:hypothetical protein
MSMSSRSWASCTSWASSTMAVLGNRRPEQRQQSAVHGCARQHSQCGCTVQISAAQCSAYKYWNRTMKYQHNAEILPGSEITMTRQSAVGQPRAGRNRSRSRSSISSNNSSRSRSRSRGRGSRSRSMGRSKSRIRSRSRSRSSRSRSRRSRNRGRAGAGPVAGAGAGEGAGVGTIHQQTVLSHQYP